MDEDLELAPPERNAELRVGLTLILLREGDITEANVDAIVNAANEQLVLGAGVAGAIRERGGPSIQQECDALGPIKVGEAVMTGGGKLTARHVIHAVGPRMGDGDEEAKLAAATRSVLRIATDNALTSLAVPALSTGIFGVPKDVCARAMLGAMVDSLQQVKTPLRQIEFCLFGADTLALFTEEMGRLRERIAVR